MMTSAAGWVNATAASTRDGFGADRVGYLRPSMKLSTHSTTLRRAARSLFGWTALRPNQLAAMRAVMKRRDALVVLPTGAGKSAIYQIPASLIPGPTVVISPLLALQQDQIAALNERQRPELRAVRISSDEIAGPAGRRRSTRSARAGRSSCSSRRSSSATRTGWPRSRALQPALVAIDEAHCISAWGHDFRPDYLALGHLIDGLGRPPVVALTATASPPVRDDIIARLRLREPEVVVSGLDRPNLFLEVAHCPTEDYRWRRLIALLRDDERPGIIYVPTRRAAEELADAADRRRLPGAVLPRWDGRRRRGTSCTRRSSPTRCRSWWPPRRSAWASTSRTSPGWCTWRCPTRRTATSRRSAGPAATAQPARVLLLWRAEDVGLQRFFSGGLPDENELRDLAALLRRKPATKTELRETTGLGPRKLGQYLLACWSRSAPPSRAPGSASARPATRPTPAEAGAAALAEAERQQTVHPLPYRHDAGLRRDHRLPGAAPAGLLRRADDRGLRALRQLSPPAPAWPTSGAVGPFPVHSQVRHAEWGTGLVLNYEDDRMTVLFDEVGTRRCPCAWCPSRVC